MTDLLCCCGDAKDEDDVIDDVMDDVIEWGLTADEAGDDVEVEEPKIKVDI